MGLCASAGGVKTAYTSEDICSNIKEPPTLLRNIGETPNMPRKEVKKGGIGHAQFILDKPGRIQDMYTLEKALGEGTYGFVCRGTHKPTGTVRAIKRIPKRKMRNIDRFIREIAIMKMMDHPGIIKLFETFEDRQNIYLAMELCSGGELLKKIIAEGRFAEADAAIVIQQVLRAVFYMHTHKVCHRDLKPENFLFQTKDPISKNVLKIIDFGLSHDFEPGKSMSTRAGTPYYVAPEVLAGKYDHQCDIWSVGVIMYVLLCGYPPFKGNTDKEVLSNVRHGQLCFNSRDWKGISRDAKELIRMLMKRDPHQRLTAEQSLSHAWIERKAPKAASVTLESSFVDKLRVFRAQDKFAKAVLHIIAGQLNSTQIKDLRAIFTSLDANGDGMLTQAELRTGLQRAGVEVTDPDLQAIVEGIDSDGSGEIDYTEFLAATLEEQQYIQEDMCWCAFGVFDLNSDGVITQSELRQVLDNGDLDKVVGTKSAADVLKEVDKNGDGVVDFDEFMVMMKSVKVQAATVQ